MTSDSCPRGRVIRPVASDQKRIDKRMTKEGESKKKGRLGRGCKEPTNRNMFDIQTIQETKQEPVSRNTAKKKIVSSLLPLQLHFVIFILFLNKLTSLWHWPDLCQAQVL